MAPQRPGVLPGSPSRTASPHKFYHDQLPGIMDPKPHRVFPQAGADHHMLPAFGKMPAAERREQMEIGRDQPSVF